MHFMKYILMTLLTALFSFTQVQAHVELGKVKWSRDFDASLARSKAEGKPVLALFQEVPGCAGCRLFGENVLGHPLLVEAIEDLFIPVAIFNNKGGEDRKILKRYNEPAWNYQVIRYLDASGKDVIQRKDRVWTIAGTAQRMIETLEAVKRPVPDYLKGLVSEANVSQHQTAAFAMYCFWDGEAKLGLLDGVIATEAGWLEGREVVKVVYDPKVIRWSELVYAAEQFDCAHKVYAPNSAALKESKKLTKHKVALLNLKGYRKAKSSDQKRVLNHSRYSKLALTPYQATKINSTLRVGKAKDVKRWLSPRQLKML